MRTVSFFKGTVEVLAFGFWGSVSLIKINLFKSTVYY